ncbi:UDP-2,4-diacetamido-2,4,6-trideoxy-beta-L-altropyranose hydrolase [Halosimplex rubrum]|uniref:UDP-2,4-diacetamido-2,4, 6-trideoxy-beta-L-altropyranose hydrolase n=1 Tax=Halosimplex rubrum TaxID=869889 RepID=A0A7D5T4C7_9EURY|nr:UDP-2,4-diacetamido-2,4,6-trideoxy-beta-L-altropyranose hydrolase [Halosimplex rubrum]QLH76829.1 UDP-2,4-diacetamido-2,4,6-trideoxy-beta-L-altropyranose hydrolase [Halosimplex rubrum]
MTGTLLIRTDGSAEIGTGHVMRCLTLAQSWHRNGGSVKFVGANIPDGLRDRIDEYTEAVHVLDSPPGTQYDASRTTSLAVNHDAEWIVVDGPHFGEEFLAELITGPARVLLIDDMGKLDYYGTDIVLNQNLHADQEMYANRGTGTELLLGPEYVLLRDEFIEWLDWTPDAVKKPESLLVTLGGSDPNDATKTVVNALDQVSTDLETVVIVGVANESLPDLADKAANVRQEITLKSNVRNMSTQMARADLAVSSGGTTCWELAFMGVPTVVGTIAPIEEHLVSGLKDAELFNHVGDFASVSEAEVAAAVTKLVQETEYRVQMSTHGQEIIDGYGRQRTIEAMRDY